MNSLQLKEFARQCGADVVGIADLTLLKGIETEPRIFWRATQEP